MISELLGYLKKIDFQRLLWKKMKAGCQGLPEKSGVSSTVKVSKIL